MHNKLTTTLRQFSTLERGVLMHHWDTDGIAAAAMVEDYFKSIGSKLRLTRFTPPIGNYFLTAEDFKLIRAPNPECIVSVDLNFEQNELDRLKKICTNFLIVDHHYQPTFRGVTVVNPISEGKPTSSAPSTTWVLNQHLYPRTLTPLGALGLVGDQQEDSFTLKKFAGLVTHAAKLQHMSVQDMLTITRRLHSIYVTNHRTEVMRAVTVLRTHSNNLSKILKIGKYKNFETQIIREVARLKRVSPTYTDGHLVMFSLKSRFHLIVEMTRWYAEQFPRHTVVVTMPHPGNKKLMSIYFRTRRRDISMEPIIRFAKRTGYSAGGRREVAGVQLPRGKVKDFIAMAILAILEK